MLLLHQIELTDICVTAISNKTNSFLVCTTIEWVVPTFICTCKRSDCGAPLNAILWIFLLTFLLMLFREIMKICPIFRVLRLELPLLARNNKVPFRKSQIRSCSCSVHSWKSVWFSGFHPGTTSHVTHNFGHNPNYLARHGIFHDGLLLLHSFGWKNIRNT